MRLRQSFYAAKPREKGLRWLSRLPLLPWRKVVKVLVKAGFKPVRQKGSHLILVKMNTLYLFQNTEKLKEVYC